MLPLKDVHIEEQGLESLFTRLSLSYDIPIGLEVGSNESDYTEHRIDFSAGTLSDLLAQVFPADSHYEWKISDEVVSIVPRDQYRDPVLKQLLDTRLRAFSIKRKTDCWTFVQSLVSTSELSQILEANSLTYRARGYTGGYVPALGKDFRLEASNRSTRSILNSAVRDSKLAKFWLIRRNDDNPRTFFISLSARHAPYPATKGEPKFPEIDF